MRAATFNILSETIAKNLKRDYYESIVNKDVAFFDTKRTGDLSKYPIPQFFPALAIASLPPSYSFKVAL